MAEHFAVTLSVQPVTGAFAGLTVLAHMDVAPALADNFEPRGVDLGLGPGLFED